MRGRRLRVEVHHLGNGQLHARRQLIRLDAGPHGRVGGVLDRCQTIQVAQQLELPLALFARDRRTGSAERERVLRIDRQGHAGVLGAQVAGAVGSNAAAAVIMMRLPHNIQRVFFHRANGISRSSF